MNYTSDPKLGVTIRAWCKAAAEDGWSWKPTYNNESTNSSGTLERDGFKVTYLTRDSGAYEKRPVYEMSGWAADGLAIHVGFPYSWEQIQAEPTTCPECGETEVKTTRVGFANRSCEKCAPALREKIETPGWTN